MSVRSFEFLQITQDLNKIKKIPLTLWYVGNVCEVSAKDIEL